MMFVLVETFEKYTLQKNKLTLFVSASNQHEYQIKID